MKPSTYPLIAIAGESLKVLTIIMILKSIYEQFSSSVGDGLLALLCAMASFGTTILLGNIIYNSLGFNDTIENPSFGKWIIGVLLIFIVFYNLYLLGLQIVIS